ncbi:pseudaminic acid synthase [Algicola sagamiensis]|uniref:pseudaminic acid synthase n=1 Tax=Algicola sagamiensis TaxID=163869 RepID=UPI00036D29EF|nr:pseudaminic acid synthase [Algicola sagamiensis]
MNPKFEPTITIDDRTIGFGQKPYIIAELSGNHNGDINRARQLIHHASKAGADAVKLQTYTADTMTIDSSLPDFQIKGGLWDGKSLYQLYEEAHTPWEWHQELFDYGRQCGISVFSSPFDESAVEFLESLNTPAYKVASFELTDHCLLRAMAETQKPLIISTGMANLEEIQEALSVIDQAGNHQVILLHCISGYPTPLDQCHLATIPDLVSQTGIAVGLSDHTLGHLASSAAIALGACVIEKHVTLRREDGGPDAAFSLEPEELCELVIACQKTYKTVGSPCYELKKAEESNRTFRRSIYVVKDLKKGDVLSERNIRRIRPGFGLAPKYYDELLGKEVNQDISIGTPLNWKFIDQEDI